MNDKKLSVTMTRERFASLVAAYGAAPQRWPAAERAAAEAFVGQDASVHSEMNESRALDALLDRVPDVAVSAGLQARVMAGFDRVAQRPTVRRVIARISQIVWPGAPVWQPSAAFAASLVAGLALGLFGPLGASATTTATNSDMTVAFVAPASTDLDGQ